MALTSHGSGLAAGIFFCISALAFLVFTLRSYLQKGPLLSVSYFAAEKEQRHTLCTPKAYRGAGHTFLFLTLIFLLMSAALLFDWSFLIVMAAGLVFLFVLCILLHLVAL